MQIKTVEDIETAKKTGKAGVIFSLQNSTAMGGDFYKWSIMAELGLKICQLTSWSRTFTAAAAWIRQTAA